MLHVYYKNILHGPAQELYAEDKRIWNSIFEMVVRDLAMCERDGVEVNGSKIYPIVLGNKGDWSYLASQCAILAFYANGICLQHGGRRIKASYNIAALVII